MLQRLKPHLILAWIFFVLTLGQQYLYYGIKGLPIILLPIAKYVGVYLFLLLFTFAKGNLTRFFLLSFTLILNFFQMAHLSYFGTQILPTEIWLFLIEMNEIGGTLGAEYYHLFLPLLFLAAPLYLGWFSIKRLGTPFQFKAIPILFCLYFAYNPFRTYFTGNTWGRQPSTRELSGMNVYLSLSYFLGKILPYKLSGQQSEGNNSSLQLVLQKEKESAWDNIIVVLGESLTPNHMHLYGYERETTPFLDSLKGNPQFFFTKGISGGVSTDVSVAFFLNFGFGAAGGLKAAKGQHCLMKLAKENGFKTSFLSTQSEQQLRYIAPYLCTSSLDEYKSLEQVSPKTVDHNAALDFDLIPELDRIFLKNQKNFIILHQRGSHAPWSLRFRKDLAKFKTASGVDTRVDDYDNSVVEFDRFWDELNTKIKQFKGRHLVIYLSDHGEGLGENGLWGHGSLTPISFEVPMMIQSFNADLPSETKNLPKFLPQYNLSLYLSSVLGYKANQDIHQAPKDYVIYGNDIDGFSGKASVNFSQDKYDFKVLP